MNWVDDLFFDGEETKPTKLPEMTPEQWMKYHGFKSIDEMARALAASRPKRRV